jgi:DNA-binding SARP family transcriptional activator
MEWRILGPVEIVADAPLPVPRPQQRAVLAFLLLNANRVISTERLVDAMWEGAPPATARTQIQACISQIRTVLRAAGAADVLESRAGGYRLSVSDRALDLTEFLDLVSRARAARAADQPAQASDLLRRALALWRGTALAGAAGEFVAAASATLEEQRVAAVEALVDAELALGRHTALVSELRGLVAQHPLREALTGHLMAALYRSGRQAEALAAFRSIRSRLADELGVEPGPELQRQHRAILTGVAELGQPPVIGADPVPVPTAGRDHLVPAQLPADLSAFTGRQAEIDALGTGLTGPAKTSVIVIVGTAGVGKTTLAVRWAHSVVHLFPDGQLYLNLRGFDPAGAPVTQAEAIRGFLDAFGVPPSRIPAALDSQTALYRSLLAGKRVLLLLDNARDAEQVRALLPGSPGCFVVVTSRDQLGGLTASVGARPLTLDVLSTVGARALLAGRLGAPRVDAEPAAVDDIIAGCARLPLALAVAAARAAADPELPLTAVARELREVRGGSGPLHSGDPATDVWTVFSLSYQALGAPAAQLFRLLGLHPGEVTAAAAASLSGLSLARARALLDELARAHLVTERLPGRFTMHDLLRVYAIEQTHAHDADSQQQHAIRRLLDHYLHSGYGAARLLDPVRDPPSLPLADAARDVIVTPLADHDAAIEWFTAEHRTLLAAVDLAARSGFDRHAWQLAWTMADFLERRGLWQDWADTQTAAVHAAVRLGALSGEAHAHRILGRACIKIGDYEHARHHFRQALDRFGQLDEYAGQAHTHLNLSAVCHDQDDVPGALNHTRQALDLYRKANHRSGEANALNGLGWYHAQQGDYDTALGHCHQALTLLEDMGDVMGEATTWDSAGYAHHRLGQHQEAITCYQQAIDRYQQVGDRPGQADALEALGDVHRSVGDHDAARASWRQALAIVNDLGLPRADELRAKIATASTDTAETA